MRLTNTVRWLLVVPSAVGAWYFVFFVGFFLFLSLVAPCWSSDEPSPAFCDAAWYPLELLEQALIPAGAGMSAFLAVVVSALVAPSHRAAVAWTTLSIGAVVAGVLGYGISAYAETAAALLAGLLAAVVVTRMTRRSQHASVADQNGVPNA